MAPRSNSSARAPHSRLPCPCPCRALWRSSCSSHSRACRTGARRADTCRRPEPKGTEVTAPMVGVFYAAPAPGDEPFVRVGSKVKAGETLCIIEAMKVLNEVTAEADGEVLEICVADGDLVEFGSCLMRIG
ncbi:MAG: acetyl-CoA carboxylase biotin carboxyl carrier protein [Collinsella sp.]